MVITSTSALLFLVLLLPVGIWVAWSDMKFMKIPNKAVVTAVGIFVVFGLIALPFSDYLWRYVHFGVVLALGFAGNLFRLFGAGDAKFASAMAMFIDLGDISIFFQILAVCLLAAFVTHRAARSLRFVRHIVPDWESWERGDFPMGLALASALLVYLALGVALGR